MESQALPPGHGESANPVTLRVKPSLVRPGTSLAGDTLILSAYFPETNPLSGDRLALIGSVKSDAYQFPEALEVPDLKRDEPTFITFRLKAIHNGSERVMGEGKVSSAELLRHADFVAQMREQKLIGQLLSCPIGVPLAGPELVGASLSVSLDIVEGAVMKAESAGDQRLCNIFLSAKGILATRGRSTDSFARVMLVLEGEVEHEVGRTEVVRDSLSPTFQAYVSFSYSVAAATKPGSKTLLRFEVCDPGTSPAAASGTPPGRRASKPSAVNDDAFAVIGAQQVLLSEVHENLSRGSGGPPGVARAAMNLKQKGELQNLLKAEEKPRDYGRIFCVLEHVREDSRCCWLVLGAKKLKTNKISMAPDPYVKIFRVLDGSASSSQYDADMPTRCPVYASSYVAHTREAAWKTSPIPMQLLCNGDDSARLILEVWDFQYNAEDRMIGSVELSAGQLLSTEAKGPQSPRFQKYARTHPLTPPSFLQATGSTVDRVTSLISGGVSSSPGEVSILSAEVYDRPEDADTHADCFDVDTILREKKASQPLQWEPLKDRRAKIEAKIRSGVLRIETSCGTRLAKSWRDCARSMATTGLTKCLMKYAVFYRTRHYVGARFGSAFEAFFAFAWTLIKMNALLALVWFLPVVLPQLLLMDPSPNLIRDVAEAFGVIEIANQALELYSQAQSAGYVSATDSSATRADLGALTAFLASGNTTTFEPGVLLFNGYLPKFPMAKLAASYGVSIGLSADALYNLSFSYIACVVAMICISLFSIVCALGSQIASVTETASSARADGTGQVLEALFGGWDFLETTSEASKKVRYSVITTLREGMGEAVRKAEASAKVKTQKQKQQLLMVRIGAGCLSALLVISSVVVVFFVSSPEGAIPGLDVAGLLKRWDKAIAVPVVTPLNNLIFISVNLASPIIIKALVKLEQWESPETDIKQVLMRQCILKMANLVVLYLAKGLGKTSTVLPFTDPARCPEGDAAGQFLTLIIMDAVIAGPVIFFVKALLYYPIRLCKKDGLGPLGKRGVFDLPTEIVNICYRQAILMVGSVVSPWLFAIGFLTNVMLYFFKYFTVVYLLRPPDKPFKASQVKKVFYAVLFVANLVAIFPVAHFLTSANNPNCGPLRTHACAQEVEYGVSTTFSVASQNQTACLYQFIQKRPNYAIFTEVLLPYTLDELDPISAVVDATQGNSTAISTISGSCGAWCWLSLVLSAVFSTVTMLILTVLLVICLCFSRAQSRRLNRQLDEAVDEVALEHRDKVRLLRYAGVSLD